MQLRQRIVQPHHNGGFTLIELSIVLVIIGLIVGGVLVGQDLIRSAALRAVYSQAQAFDGAAVAFKLKYQGIPGDFSNASTFWPSCQSPAVNCNGDGDRIIEQNDPGVCTPYCENFLAWQHLSLAQLIEGEYTGIGYTVDNFRPGVNAPEATGFSGGGFLFGRPAGLMPSTLKAHRVQFHGSENYRNGTPVLAPSDAKQIDDKFDDGMASSGSVTAFNARNGSGTWLSGCVDYGAISWAGVAVPWNYDLSANEVRCYMGFRLSF